KSEHNNSNKGNNKPHIKNSYTHIPTHRRQRQVLSLPPLFLPSPLHHQLFQKHKMAIVSNHQTPTNQPIAKLHSTPQKLNAKRNKNAQTYGLSRIYP
ncbi:hypothetical protein, partial [uncultured Muribaculum sp.]|uniref:hypothetical protein n=1 Tax=uncultured Muribaculum sp. TaxID=1918613 RepID=UPI0027295FEF